MMYSSSFMILIFVILLSTCFFTKEVSAEKTTKESRFTIENDAFFLDGKRTVLKSGSLHYARVVPEYWEDRMMRMKSLGLNTVMTYVPWNWHETKRGEIDFESPDRDLGRFLSIAEKLDMMVILRAGPYICGEWDFGGLPSWILQNGTIELRTDAEPYMSLATEWLQGTLYPYVKPYLIDNGGSIVMVQVENEYGSFGDVSTSDSDRSYLEKLVQIANESLGEKTLLFTTDGGSESFMTRGSLKGSAVYTVGDGCGNIQDCIDAQKAFNPVGKSPFFCSECYTGWLTHWGENGANTSSSAPHVQQILDANGSVSLYMAHGGTNFGFWNGANGNGGTSYQPTITSYDYNSPISESGSHGWHQGVDKFEEMARVLLDSDTPSSEEPAFIPVRAYVFLYFHSRIPQSLTPQENIKLTHYRYGNVSMSQRANLFDNLDTLVGHTLTDSRDPVFGESIGCQYGLILYTHEFEDSSYKSLSLNGGVKDRAQVFVNGLYQGLSYRVSPSDVTLKSSVSQGDVLQILVENMGRINFSPGGMKDTRKGLTGNVTADGKTVLSNWNITCIPLDNYTALDEMTWEDVGQTSLNGGPTFYRTNAIDFDGHSDTFLNTDSTWLSKGFAWVNGFHLGRYWPVQGPQKTLYVPAPRTVGGDRRLVMLELEAHADDAADGDGLSVSFQDYSVLSHT